MYVCLCAAVTESQIENAIQEGATSLKLLRARLDVTNCCGACEPVVRDCLAKGKSADPAPHLKIVGA